MSRTSFFLLLLIASACTTLEVENQVLVDTDILTPESITTSLQVVNLTVEEDSFSYMYDNYKDDIIISAEVDWYDQSKSIIMQSKSSKIQIKGAGSAANPLKSLEITFDEAYDNSTNPILNPDKVNSRHSLSSLKSIRLRNSGSDFYRTMFRDLAMTQLAIETELDIDLTYGTPVHAFVNGDYYGLLNLRNETNEESVAALNNTDLSNVTLMEVDRKNGNLEYRYGNEQLADSLRSAIKHGKTDELWEMLDIPSFIDYILFEDYIGNNDWPHNNSKAYSVNGGKFRFLLYDLDRAGETSRTIILPKLEYRDMDIGLIYQALMERAEFIPILERRQEEIYDLVSPSVFQDIVSSFQSRIEEDITYQISKYQVPESELHWHMYIEELMREFKIQDKRVRKKYNLD